MPSVARIWSSYQQAIFAFLAESKDNLLIDAKAGSGKTSTIEEAFKRIPSSQSAIFLAFNKSVADELKSRGVNARTFHSLCFSPVLRAKQQRDVTKDKPRKLLDKIMTSDQSRMYGGFAMKLLGLARQVGIGCLVEDTERAWYDLIEHHDLDLDDERADMGDAVAFARKLLRASNASPLVDFDDMLYLAVKDGISLPKFDVVFVDEAQDTNAVQRAILKKITKTRLVAVGDPGQAIYGFRGADSSSMERIADEFRCATFPLSVSYRCSRAVVDYARQWVEDILPRDDAPAGETTDMDENWNEQTFALDDLVVCRTTKPLIALGYRLLKARVPVRILGRDIGEGLIALIKKLDATSVDELNDALIVWRDREVEKALVKDEEAKAESIRDKANALLFLIDGLSERRERTIASLLSVINTLFSPAGGRCVTLATIHKAKGLESERVFWLNSSQCPSPWARQPWQKQQERNLCYVATTRAKTALFFIEDGSAR